jgi:5-methylthioadenosine/S-adenosylhomocysteine deaminase
MWPAEGRWVSESFIDVGTTLSCIELLKSGVTCVNDMYFFPDTIAQVRKVEKALMRKGI